MDKNSVKAIKDDEHLIIKIKKVKNEIEENQKKAKLLYNRLTDLYKKCNHLFTEVKEFYETEHSPFGDIDFRFKKEICLTCGKHLRKSSFNNGSYREWRDIK